MKKRDTVEVSKTLFYIWLIVFVLLILAHFLLIFKVSRSGTVSLSPDDPDDNDPYEFVRKVLAAIQPQPLPGPGPVECESDFCIECRNQYDDCGQSDNPDACYQTLSTECWNYI